jgi:dienelactone hydrolase
VARLSTLLLVTAAALAQDFSAPGPYNDTFRVMDIPGTTETMRNSRVYYPDSSGVLPGSAVPAPIAVFGHGWQMGIDRYYSYAAHLASWGYVCVLPTISNPLINPEHDKRARLMADAARFVGALDTVPGDPFFGKLDRDNWGFTGHSMGGSISMLAADTLRLGDTLRCVVGIACPQTTPPTRSANIRVPKLLLPGGVDNIAGWTGVRSAFWADAPPPGVFAVIGGANHGYVMDYSYFWENGGNATITRAEQQRITRRHLTAFFERYLHGDSSDWNFAYCYGDSILGHPTMDSVEVRLPTVGVEEGRTPDASRRTLHATVVRGSLILPRSLAPRPSPVLLDASGREVMGLCPGDNDVSGLTPGVYFLHAAGPAHRLVLLD